MKVYVIREEKKGEFSEGGGKLAAYIHAHGGACIVGSAESGNPRMCRLACESNLVVFNVEYRLAPEHRVPAGA